MKVRNSYIRLSFKAAAIYSLLFSILLFTGSCKKNTAQSEAETPQNSEAELNTQVSNIVVNCKNLDDCKFLESNLEEAKSGDQPLVEKLKNINAYDLRILRNTIFAKQGYKFKSADLHEHFKSYPWYAAEKENVSELLSATDKANIKLLKRLEDEAATKNLKKLKSMFPLYCNEGLCQCICSGGMITKSPQGESFLGLQFNKDNKVTGSRFIEHENLSFDYAGTWATEGSFLKMSFTETVNKDDPSGLSGKSKVIETREYSCKVKVASIEKESEIHSLVGFYGHGYKYRCQERLAVP